MAGVDDLKRAVATACRVLADQGLVEDILGHVSARTLDGVLVRCRGPQERGLLFTTPDDIQLIGDLADGYATPNELPIHTEVLRARPEVNAVVHAHPPFVVAADLAGAPLRPIFGAYNIPAARMALERIPVYPRGVLIRTPELGQEMVEAMGDKPVCILRGHGITTVGDTVGKAVVRALTLNSLARMTLLVRQFGGEPTDLDANDLAVLPDLGSGFNVEALWRYHEARLEQND